MKRFILLSLLLATAAMGTEQQPAKAAETKYEPYPGTTVTIPATTVPAQPLLTATPKEETTPRQESATQQATVAAIATSPEALDMIDNYLKNTELKDATEEEINALCKEFEKITTAMAIFNKLARETRQVVAEGLRIKLNPIEEMIKSIAPAINKLKKNIETQKEK